jgi:histidinol-phosphate/aromatic aminotransferase/cobyric acid decarboxylase-like protein
LEVVPSHTNFALIRLGDKYDPGETVEGLKKRGYLVKGPLGADCVSDCIRIALGPPDMMADFSKSLAETLASDF